MIHTDSNRGSQNKQKPCETGVKSPNYRYQRELKINSLHVIIKRA